MPVLAKCRMFRNKGPARSASSGNRTNLWADHCHSKHPTLRQHRHNGLQSLDRRDPRNGSTVNIATQPGSLGGNKITSALLAPFAQIVGGRYAVTDAASQEPYLK